MNVQFQEQVVTTTAATTATLPYPAVQLKSVVLEAADGTAASDTIYTIVTGTPSASDVQFTGTPQIPSTTLTFSAALTAGQLLRVIYAPPGSIPAAS